MQFVSMLVLNMFAHVQRLSLNSSRVLVEGNSYLCSEMEQELKELEGVNGQAVQIINKWVEARGETCLDIVLDRFEVPKGLDLMDIDVDGIDYHLWKHLEDYRPRVMLIEYNASIPPHETIIGRETYNTVGASLQPLVDLGRTKGYDLVGLTPSNAVFVRGEESEPFEAKNDIDRLWDPEHQGQYMMLAYQTFEEELFFPRGPVIRDDFAFAERGTVHVRQEDELFFARPQPKPHETWDYFVSWPLRYFFFESRVFDRIKTRFERWGFGFILHPLISWLEEYE